MRNLNFIEFNSVYGGNSVDAGNHEPPKSFETNAVTTHSFFTTYLLPMGKSLGSFYDNLVYIFRNLTDS